MDENDAQLPLKKRARRRLVGAIFFVSVVALVLPMVMDHEPRQTVQDVEIRIPGQDEKPFAPKFAAAPLEKAPEKSADKTPVIAEKVPVAVPEAKSGDSAAKPSARVLEAAKDVKTDTKTPEKPIEKVAEKSAPKSEKTPEKAPEKPAAKTQEKLQEKPVEKARADDAKRAAALLAGNSVEAKPAEKGGEYLILIGAFSNEVNVKNLKSKLSEQGIKTYSEPLDTPQGKKTRVRAGPFASRDAAEKALGKMQRIGVAGVIAAKP